MRRYLGIGLTILLIMTALLLPGWWFALRDAASQSRMQGEALAPLMVAQLDRSYENDIHERMSAYFAANAQGNVICSSKEVDAGNEALWENVVQTEQSILMRTLLGSGYVSPYGEKWGDDMVVKSCTQYVLIRESDGQILLVANDIHLERGDGGRVELLIDGLDGTVYYAESEEEETIPLQDWMDGNAWEWWWILCENYHAESSDLVSDSEQVSNYEYWGRYVDTYKGSKSQSVNAEISLYNSDKELPVLSEYFQDVKWIRLMESGLSPSDVWIASWAQKDVYCCQLSFGHISDSWSMETERTEEDFYRIRLGFPGVVRSIPEMAQRIDLAQYNQIYNSAEQETQTKD